MPAAPKPTYPTTTIIPGAGDDSGGGGGPVAHSATTGRSNSNQHPASAVSVSVSNAYNWPSGVPAAADDAFDDLAARSPRRTLVADMYLGGVAFTSEEIVSPSNPIIGFLPAGATILVPVDGQPQIWQRVEQGNEETDPGFALLYDDLVSGIEHINDNVRVSIVIDNESGESTLGVTYVVVPNPETGDLFLVERGTALLDQLSAAIQTTVDEAVPAAAQDVVDTAIDGLRINPGLWLAINATVIDCLGTTPVLDGTSYKIGPNESSSDIAGGPVLIYNAQNPEHDGWWIYTMPEGTVGDQTFTPMVRANGDTVIAVAPNGNLTIAQAAAYAAAYGSFIFHTPDLAGLPTLHMLSGGDPETPEIGWTVRPIGRASGLLRLSGVATVPTWATMVRTDATELTLASANSFVVIHNTADTDMPVKNVNDDEIAVISGGQTLAFVSNNGFAAYDVFQLDGPTTSKVAPLVVASTSADIELDPAYDVFPIEMAFTESSATLDVNAPWLDAIPGRQIKVFLTDRQDASTSCIVHAAGQDATIEPGQAVTITALDASVGIVEFSATP